MEIDIDKIIRKGLSRVPFVRDETVFSPSDIGMCMRYLYYSYKTPKPESEENSKIYALGNKVHDMVKEAIIQYNKLYNDFSDIKFEYPVEISHSDFKIKGKVDALLTLQSGEAVVLEIKSASDVSRITEPEDRHLWQTTLYIKAAAAKYGIIAYIQKNNAKVKQFRVEMNESIYNQIMERFELLRKYLKSNTLPPAEYLFDSTMSWYCSRCIYRDQCFSDLSSETV
jgi:CRISPR-associated protein Cas4